jgi:hypothetical protein
MRRSETAASRLISIADRVRLGRFLDACEARLTREHSELGTFRARLESAVAVASDEMPENVTTMHAQVRMRDLKSDRTFVCTVDLPPIAKSRPACVRRCPGQPLRCSARGRARNCSGEDDPIRAECASRRCCFSRKRWSVRPARRRAGDGRAELVPLPLLAKESVLPERAGTMPTRTETN